MVGLIISVYEKGSLIDKGVIENSLDAIGGRENNVRRNI
jgi:hypothetical protein